MLRKRKAHSLKNIINNWKKGDDAQMKEIIKEEEQWTYSMFDRCVNEEKRWAEYLFKDGSMIGLNDKLLHQYVEWIANRRMKSIGLTPVDESKMPFAGCLWYSNDFCNSYERRMEEVCLNQNVPFLPTFREMYSDKRSKNWITHDGIHLNSEGHFWLFQRLKSWKILTKWKES